jgi:ferrous iron transport protein A
MRDLSMLGVGKKAHIRGFKHNSSISLKLMEMGCLPNAEVVVYQCAPLGCPLCIEIGGACLSLRRREASNILIEELQAV